MGNGSCHQAGVEAVENKKRVADDSLEQLLRERVTSVADTNLASNWGRPAARAKPQKSAHCGTA
jgi:hypothetical protein